MEAQNHLLGRKNPEGNVFKQFLKQNVAAVVCYELFIHCSVQYVLGPRLKIITLNILPESKRNERKYSLKIIVMFLSILVKWQVQTLGILLVIRKKGTVPDGPY